jgi:hypothetical protein
MTKDELKELLESQTNEEFVEREFFSRRPWIFPTDEEHSRWGAAIAGVLNVEVQDVRVVGSAATGYSLSPLKAGRSFRRQGSIGIASDIDVALMSDVLFEEAWNTILILDRRHGLRMSTEERTKIRVDVYWGVVAQRSLPANSDPARRVLTAMSVATRVPPIRGHIVRCRIYRRAEDLRAYHVDSLRKLRAQLQT